MAHSRFFVILLAVASVEMLSLGLVRFDRIPPVPVERPHRPVRVSFVHRERAKSFPEPREKKIAPARKISRPAPQPKPAASAPGAVDETKNLLAASAGEASHLDWGNAAPSSGVPANYSPPVLLTKIDTDSLYTPRMKSLEEEGDVVIDVRVDTQGRISRSMVVVPSVYQDINRIAAGLLPSLRFEPAHTGEQKTVEGEFQLHFRFRMRHS